MSAETKSVQVDRLALTRLDVFYKSRLTRQQYKTLRGQILAGDADGAMRGAQKLIAAQATKRA